MQLDAFATAALDELRRAGLFRHLRPIAGAQGPSVIVDGREVLNFSSNDYLGLANDPVLREAAVRALERHGVGSGASRLVCGNLAPYGDLEKRLAAFKGKPAAVVFGSGYAAGVGTISALVGKGDTVILDKLDHASLVDGVRLSGATLRVYPHGNLNKLEKILQSKPSGRVLIITETVFSMDGDIAPLREIVELKDRHGAWLMIDEAHATGLYGSSRRGVAEALGVEDHVDVTLGTLSKAFGCVGGFVCGSRPLMELLINRARSLIYSTALPPAMVAAATAAVEFVTGPAGRTRCQTLWQRIDELKTGVERLGHANMPHGAILPLLVGDELRAVEFSRRLFDHGFFVPGIRHPTVAHGAARLRLTVTASHTPDQIQRLLGVLPVVWE